MTNNTCIKCGYYEPDDELFTYVNSVDKIMVACARCGYAWLVEPADIDKPPEGLDI